MMNVKRIRDVLNVLFMIGAVTSIVTYFVSDDRLLFFYICTVTLALKFVEFILRFTIRTK
ncbi:MAG TPA: hypothetical protein IAA93_02855 [Candidatus Avibacteroides avistercoris]|uniref:Uncharacterized protein n=1 Tax=Candidatus Avibacteroides avistercoris TaxID=2840690 RepID=A0A9D2UHQ0_9BACT|nr:hypothetical protein [Candidatus Avibacteroides avistercoris]